LHGEREHGIPEDAFVVLYAGTMGIVSGAEVLLDVAREFSGDPGIFFLFVGEGRSKERIQVQGRSLPHVRFFGFQPGNICRGCSPPRMWGS